MKKIYILIIIVLITGCKNINATKDIIKENKIEKNKVEDKKEFYFVDIKGAVNNPGVYKLQEDSRVIDVIDISGGLKDNADTSNINLSKKIFDEMFIIIYTKDEIEKYKKETISTREINKKLENQILNIDKNNDAQILNNSSSKNEKVNINEATKEELQKINGIGEGKADNIIKYRNENGIFNSIEDIKNINGIGESLFEKIKDYISI